MRGGHAALRKGGLWISPFESCSASSGSTSVRGARVGDCYCLGTGRLGRLGWSTAVTLLYAHKVRGGVAALRKGGLWISPFESCSASSGSTRRFLPARQRPAESHRHHRGTPQVVGSLRNRGLSGLGPNSPIGFGI